MKMKIPTSPVGNGSYGQSDPPYEIDEDDLDVPSENDDDFSEYLWMENEEEFDKMEMQRLEEEELMEECICAMFADEFEAELARIENSEYGPDELCDALSTLDIENSILNPLAAEFVPAVPADSPST